MLPFVEIAVGTNLKKQVRMYVLKINIIQHVSHPIPIQHLSTVTSIAEITIRTRGGERRGGEFKISTLFPLMSSSASNAYQRVLDMLALPAKLSFVLPHENSPVEKTRLNT